MTDESQVLDAGPGPSPAASMTMDRRSDRRQGSSDPEGTLVPHVLTRPLAGRRSSWALTAAALAVVVGLAGCSGSAGDAPPSPATSSASSAPSSVASSSSPATSSSSTPSSASSAAAGPAWAATLTPALQAEAEELLVTGAAVLVRTADDGDWTMTYGTRTWDGSDPVDLGDHVRIGSVTKTWTGTVILQLVDEGRLALTDPVSQYVAGVPNGDRITIEQLLTMHSGLANYTTDPVLNEAMDTTPERVWEPEELLAMGLSQAPSFPPGEQFEYSNTNTVLLGVIIEQLTGQPVETAFQERILDRVGMTGSKFPARADATLTQPHPQGYTYGTNVETMESTVLPESVQDEARAGTRAPMDVTDVNPSWGWTAGAGISTAADLADYVTALVDGGLLSPELQQQRLDSVAPIDPDDPASAAYGMALARFGPLYGHTGELPGFNTFAGHDPDTGTTVVVWTSLAPSVDGLDPAVELTKLIIGALSAG
jgi:D-alanyl-D-alanine carboxypeptidase